MTFRDIPQFPQAYYQIHAPLGHLENTLNMFDCPEQGSPLVLNPEWQRGHVWCKEQQTAYMEYFLKGGTTGSNIYFNCSTWTRGMNTPTYCVDGLQRLTAAMAFMRNEIPVFGHLLEDFSDRPGMTQCRFEFRMLCIRSKKELLSIYLDFNSGGTPHNQKELDRVAAMIKETGDDEVL